MDIRYGKARTVFKDLKLICQTFFALATNKTSQ